MRESIFYRRLVLPIINLLRQGTSPKKIALSIAFGMVLGIAPGIGWSTILCTLAAIRFKLNLPAVQLVNYLSYPLQFALLVPFIRAGEFLFHAERLPLSLTQILAMVRADYLHAIKALWMVAVRAMTAWVIVAPLAIYVIYRLLSPVMHGLARATGLEPEKPASACESKAG